MHQQELIVSFICLKIWNWLIRISIDTSNLFIRCWNSNVGDGGSFCAQAKPDFSWNRSENQCKKLLFNSIFGISILHIFNRFDTFNTCKANSSPFRLIFREVFIKFVCYQLIIPYSNTKYRLLFKSFVFGYFKIKFKKDCADNLHHFMNSALYIISMVIKLLLSV